MSESKHVYKPLPRGDHHIVVSLCHDCDHWHASDDSILYNETDKRAWADANAALEARLALVERKYANRLQRSLIYYDRMNAAEARLALVEADAEAGWYALEQEMRLEMYERDADLAASNNGWRDRLTTESRVALANHEALVSKPV